MNRTPRDKALIEYCKALGTLKERKANAIEDTGHLEYRCDRPFYRGLYHIDEVILDAWAKRKVLRRTCKDCAFCEPYSVFHGECYYYKTQNCCNTRTLLTYPACDYFNPRKEGE